jgi:hypothetical protein
MHWKDIEQFTGWTGGLENKAQEMGWKPKEDGQ